MATSCETQHITPCGSCPWRKGADKDRIPGYSSELAHGSLSACAGDGDDFRPIMACHHSTDGDERACAGYVASDDGWANLAVRVGAITGAIAYNEIASACEQLDLHTTYDEMLDALDGEPT